MERVLHVNTVYNKGSTGKIVKGIIDVAKEKEVLSLAGFRYGEDKVIDKNAISISSYLDCHIHNRLARYTLKTGGYSYFKTLKFLKKVKKFNPDIIHLHNLHGNYINLKLLFKFINKRDIKVIWTLHDCWSFTGNCAHFDMVGCEKWKTGCYKCLEYNKWYIRTFVDGFKKAYNNKKRLFTSVNDMTIITPSKWLKGLVEQSFLNKYPIKVINNGIDLSVFKPTESDFRKKYNLENKKIVLGVSFGWGNKKGLDVFIELAKTLPSDYQVVLVGTSVKTDAILPKNIISIHKTNNQRELAEIYSVSNVFVNPTREDTFPTVNIEALACGTPVITFKTGGSPEIIDETCGVVVEKNDFNSIYDVIVKVCENKPFSKEDCLSRAKNYDMFDKFKEYVELYEKE